MKTLAFLTTLSFTLCAQSDFYAIKTVITHNPEYSHDTWDAILKTARSLIEGFEKEATNHTAESFNADLSKTAQTANQIYALIKNGPSFQFSMVTSKSEELFNVDKRMGLHIDLIFKPSEITDQNKFQNIFDEFAITCQQNVELALDDFSSTIKNLFNEFYGNAEILIHESHNDD